MTLDVHQTLTTRRTIHFYLPKPVPPEAIGRALDAAIRAPNHKLTNPWRFTLIGPDTRQKITKLGVELKTEGKDLGLQKVEKTRQKLAAPPHLLVVSQVRAPDMHRAKEDYAAVACAIQNLSLSLWSEGIGSKWSSGALTSHATTYHLTGIEPKAEEIVGFVWIGYPLDIPDSPRLAKDEVLRHMP